MAKEQIVDITFSEIPDVRVRVINEDDTKEIKETKKKYPFELHRSIDIFILTDVRKFEFTIFNGYTWNGADIPRILWFSIGSRTDNDFLIASMIHDYLLEFKKYMLEEVLENSISVKEYRRLTSLIFRHILKEQGINTIKANIMSWAVQVFQATVNYKQWQV